MNEPIIKDPALRRCYGNRENTARLAAAREAKNRV